MSTPVPYLAAPAPNGKEAIHAAGEAVDHLTLDTSTALREAVRVARHAADGVKRSSESIRWDMWRYTGMRIAKYQNWLYEQNRAWHFRDETLCVLWSVEFPDAKCDYATHLEYIASTRRDYNAGRHQADAPLVPCISYDRRRKTTQLSR